MTVRQNWGEDRAYYRDERGELTSIPACWTDAAPLDPVVVVSAGRSAFRLQDLVVLTRLVAASEQERTDEQ